MNGIASKLDSVHASKVEALHRKLEQSCGLKGVQMTPFPHLTWQVVETYDLHLLEQALRSFSRQNQPFTIHTAGLGVFSSLTPIIYLAVVKDEPLLRFHARLWELTLPCANAPSPYYLPGLWVPHITLAIEDVTHHNLPCAMDYLAFEPFEWEIGIDNLICITKTDNEIYNSCDQFILGIS